jgi:ring-1,2-phenylacetyl-CoA epoxidase subunit PaaE
MIETPRRVRVQFHPLTVAGIETLTPHARAITFTCPQELAEEFRYQPGQHLTLRRFVDGEEVRRSYSICAVPRAEDTVPRLRVASAHVPGGVMSTYLAEELAVGDTVEVMAPTGSFTCPVNPDAARHHVAFAAGSGITPVLALIGAALEREPLSSVTLVYGNRNTESIMFLEELEDLKNRYPERFQLVNVLSREEMDAELFSGRLDADRIARLLAVVVPPATVDEWYLCGPLGMVEAAQGLLAEAGVDSAHVHHEIFHTDVSATLAVVVDVTAPPEAVVTVTLDGRRTVVPMPTKAESILAATLRARPDAPYSCTGGMCGTCRARVVDGEVRMDKNYALEPDEVAKGIVLACQAHPVTDTVTLDYDA